MADSPAEMAPRRRWRWIILSLVTLMAAFILVWGAEDTANVTRTSGPPPAPVVTVVEVMPADAIARVSVFAELRPRWDAEIRAAVSGRIVEVHQGAHAGERVSAGAPLFSIEKTQYQTAVAAAELGLEEAKLALWRARNGVTLARAEYKRAGTKPPNELALRLPQRRIAERTVASAEAQLESAGRQLADTDVSAPFSGYVTRRMASLGQTVAVGEPLVHLSDDSRFELVVELSEADWALLAHPFMGTHARLSHRDGTALGRAQVRQGGGFLDGQTRQRRIFLDVVDPGDGILAGDFVRVTFNGRSIADTLTIPESALSRAGYVWVVNTQDRLVRIEPHIHFRSDDKLIIAAPEGRGPWRVAVTPLAAFLPDQRVSPQLAEAM